MASIAVRKGLVSWLVVLLAASVVFNYIDRAAIGLAAPLLKDELALSATAFGIAVSAFFWIYAPVQLFVGWLCDRFCVYRLMAAGVALWALSTTLVGLVNGLTMLVILRLLLGLGESVAFPGSSKVIANEVSPELRGRANSVVGAAIAIGPAVGTLAGGLILDAAGWRAMFLVFGLATLLWLVPWWLVTRPFRARGRTTPREAPVPLVRLLRVPALWAMSIGHLVSNYGFYFLVAWLPLYLTKVRGYSIVDMTMLTAFGFAVQAIAALFWGWASDHWVRRGVSEGQLRKALMALGHFALACALLGIVASRSTVGLSGWLVVAGIGLGAITTNLYAIAQMFAGPRAAGGWIGVQNAIGNLSGIIGPIVTGLIIDNLGGYDLAFIVAAAVTGFGALWWWLAIPRVEAVALDH